tara:strand:- start:2848 stop:3057 length:210 start_codon:yes stop_codon:yes gene_type:complete
MESIKAIVLMALWTVLSLYTLYYLGAFENFRNLYLIVPISLSLLGIHMFNMFIYFKVGENKPYEWKRLN